MIGPELRAVREQLGITREACAEAGGLSLSVLEKLERGDRYPSLRTLEALAACLGVSIIITPTETYIEPLP